MGRVDDEPGSSDVAAAEADQPEGGEGERPGLESTRPRASDPPEDELFVVALGASAGGLDALSEFFAAVPEGCGLAFVVVVHLAPDHVSLLPELLQKRTSMPVAHAADGDVVEPDRVYVIPPDRELAISDGALQVRPSIRRHHRSLPVDVFLRSLAEERGPRAACVVLSGTGTDGTLGLRAVKAQAGLAVVQAPGSGQHDGMPSSARSTGIADLVLPPAEMPAPIVAFARQRAAVVGEVATLPPEVLRGICHEVRARTGHDFSQYKETTIWRRVERRMAVRRIEDPAEYVQFLADSPEEAEILFRELLIGVTSFFRDTEALDLLRERYLPELIADWPEESPLRVWVPGCSTGEEAYSLAMVVHEATRGRGRHVGVQVFGTDIDGAAVERARAGVYPESIVADVEPERLRRYFSKEEGGSYKVRKTIREMLVFAPQSVIKDPPFTRIDLISCRNLLIYLRPPLQERLLRLFGYALEPEGLLLLGSSETIGSASDLFATLDARWKIYRKRPGEAPRQPVRLPLLPTTPAALTRRRRGAPAASEDRRLVPVLEALLGETRALPCAVVDDTGAALYIHGRTGAFLEPAPGVPSADIVAMARPGLRGELASALQDAALHGTETTRRGLQVRQNGGTIEVDIRVKPLRALPPGPPLLLVLFDCREPVSEGAEEAAAEDAALGREPAADLERELERNRMELRSTVEELETSNEELRSANEELQSANEELQSTNEELETSKEELQSLNEEASSANAELQSRIDDLTRAHDDMKNLLDSTEIAVVFLDRDLCVRRTTPKATAIVPITDADRGRPISHFATDLVDVDLQASAREVLDDLATRHVEVRTKAGRELGMRLRPYRTVDNVIDGVVIVFDDRAAPRQG